METSEIILDAPVLEKSDARLGTLFLSLLGMTALADFCLWRDNPGLSVGLFAIGAAGIILANRPGFRWTRRTLWLGALLLATALQSAIALCFSNGLVLAVLMLALAGETFYESRPPGWSRWSEALWTMFKTPGRWFWLTAETGKQVYQTGPSPLRGIRRAVRAAWIIAPGLVVTLIFGAILASGNAMFANLTSGLATAFENWFINLNLSFWHCLFWVFVIWTALPLLHPSPAPGHRCFWTKELPPLPAPAAERTARLQSAVMLGLLNALFCCVNTLDVIYLWARQTLPANVSYSAFVHEGTASLIIAVVFSAILLAGMFHQIRPVSSWKPLRLLGLLWIAQNLVLLAGMFLRVKLYVDALDLTVIRVNLTLFLLLVTAGFVLLAIRVWWQRPLICFPRPGFHGSKARSTGAPARR